MKTPPNSARQIRSSSSSAFSLFELLAAVAVIFVMVAMLLPAYQAVRQKAEQIHCAARLRSWGVSFQLYASDHNGVYPYGWVNDTYHYLRLMEPYVEPTWRQDLPWAWADGTVIGGGYNRRIDRKKSGCPTYLRTWTQDVFAPGFAYKVEPLPYAYNSARMDYYFWNVGQVGQGWSGSNPFYAFHQRYIGMANSGAGTDDCGYFRKRSVPHTRLYDPCKSIAMSCGTSSHWKMGVWGVVATWSSNPFGTPDGWDAKQKNWQWTHEEMRGVHQGRDNHLFMDGHIECLAKNDPNLNFYMYNKIPARGNPWL